ncbi:hypothetical protein H9P43_008112 [Blastocladiella emersonii ATCC 22665]|nr:hypothetical protein H9P43_008112 [Blastocladiella emersonii ATCC 22665]
MADATDRTCVYGLRNQTRALAALAGESERNIFLIGTLGLASAADNELHVVEYLEDRAALAHVVFRHPQEIHAIASCAAPDARNIVATSYNVVGERSHRMRSTLWRLDDAVLENVAGQNGAVNLDLEPLVNLEDKFSKTGICEVLFNPAGSTSKVVGRDTSQLAIYSLSEGLSTAVMGASIAVSSDPLAAPIHAACWNPHSVGPTLAVTHGSALSLADLRSASLVATHADLHGGATPLRSVDFNPNKPYQVCTGGDDGSVRFWDLRNGAVPLLTLPGAHSHWTTRAQYNRFHDQLVLSASTDHSVAVNSISSISSQPLAMTGGGGGSGGGAASDTDDEGGAASPASGRSGGDAVLADGPVLSLDHHEDSVYGLAWSAADPWVFCTSSYDGRIVVHTVPSAIKYKIMGL